jgi:molybdenum cofactor biosynthesis enzyme MoaA
VVLLSQTVLEKVEEIGRKLDELRDFLEDVFLTTEEYTLLKEIDEIVKNKRFDELKPLD